jgi:hypothetical protein
MATVVIETFTLTAVWHVMQALSPRKQPHDKLQMDCVEELRARHPDVLTRLGGLDKAGNAERQDALNRLGHMKGVPDLTIDEPNADYSSLHIEFKSPPKDPKKGGGDTPKQGQKWWKARRLAHSSPCHGVPFSKCECEISCVDAAGRHRWSSEEGRMPMSRQRKTSTRWWMTTSGQLSSTRTVGTNPSTSSATVCFTACVCAGVALPRLEDFAPKKRSPAPAVPATPTTARKKRAQTAQTDGNGTATPAQTATPGKKRAQTDGNGTATPAQTATPGKKRARASAQEPVCQDVVELDKVDFVSLI